MGAFIKRLMCTHEKWSRFRTIHGDERNYARSEWRCDNCDKHKYSDYDDKMGSVTQNKKRFVSFLKAIRYVIGGVALRLLNKEDKERIYRDFRFQQEVRTLEHWMCEFPQMAEAARYLRVHVNGYSETLRADHPDRRASQEIASFREDCRRRFPKL